MSPGALDDASRMRAARWFLIHTRPNGERKAELHLRAQGFDIFLPRILKTIRHARQLRTIRSPLFPRYMFIRLDLLRDRWLSVRSTVGVSYLFTQDGRPLPVPGGIVESIMNRADGQLVRLDQELTTGQKIRILSGPFADLIGTLERLDENGRVLVLLQLMGSAIPVSLHRSVLSPAA